MAKSSAPFTNFTAGELSPRLDGRTDLAKYFNGCKKLQNFLTFPQGGVTRRPGTEHIAAAPDFKVRLIPFEFNVEQTYVLEFSSQKFRIYRDGGIVVDGSNNPVEVTTKYTQDQLSQLKFTQSADTMYIVHPDHPPRQITRTGHASWTIADIDFRRGPMLDPKFDGTTLTADNRLAATIITSSETDPWASGDVDRFVKIHHGYAKITNVHVVKITVDGFVGTFTVGEQVTVSGVTGNADVVYQGLNYLIVEGSTIASLSDNDTIQGANSSATCNVNGAQSNLNRRDQVYATIVENEDRRIELAPFYTNTTISFKEGDPDATGLPHNDFIEDSKGNFVDQGFKVGMLIDFTSTGHPGNNRTGVKIVAVSETVLTLAIHSDIASKTASQSGTVNITGVMAADDEYALGAFCGTTGYPSCVSFFEQRLVFANTSASPQTLFFSVSGDYTNFTSGVKDDSALTYTIGSNQVNVIRYLTSARVLLVGTSGGEFAVRAGSVDAPITPLNTQIKQQAKYGSADIQPIVIGSTALFVQREKRKVRELVYDFNVDSYIAPDMTLLAEHITEGKIKEMAYQQEPNNVVWCVLENGKLVAMTYRREEDVVAWHEHLLGGTFTDGSTTYDYGFVESIASISSSDRTEEEIYVCVRRTINSVNVRHIERLKPIDFGEDIEDAFYVDAGLSYDGSATTSITGLDHLEGETVSILANGATHPSKTVSSGSITLDYSVTKAHVGLPFDSILQTMRPDAGGTEGTSQAKNKRISDIDVRVLNSVGAKIGPSETNLDTIFFRKASMAMDTAVPLYTGDKFIEFAGGYDNDGFVVVKQDQPLPLTILSIYPRLQTFDR